MKSILVIDDDERLLFLITQLLLMNNFKVDGVKSTAQARSILNKKSFDALVVDWMLPNENGIEFIKSIRSSAFHLKDIPAIMLTAIDGIDNKTIGFESGFDDYLTKPFEEKELILRLNSLLKRSKKEDINDIVEFGNCSFNLKTNELIKEDEVIYLSSTELILLKTLCQRPNIPHSRYELSKNLAFQISDRSIDVQITRLRKKIGGKEEIIKTVRHIGYLIIVKNP